MSLDNATDTGSEISESGAGHLTIYADFNCPFCYALNERVHVLGLENQVEYRYVQHTSGPSRILPDFDLLSELTSEVAEVRRRTPATRINIPLIRPNTAAATALVSAVQKRNPYQAAKLRRAIFRALWLGGRDISDPDLLAGLLQDLDVPTPGFDANLQGELIQWQNEWQDNADYDRNIPIVISSKGETVVGFPLEPELDSFLNTGSLVSERVNRVKEHEPLQKIMMLDKDIDSICMVIEQMRDAQIEISGEFSKMVASAMNRGIPDLVLVNTSLLGDVEGTDWWRDSMDSEIETAVPVIFVSENKTIQAEVSAFESGAADFITKPFHPSVLQARLNMHLQARKSQQQLNNIARFDALTSINNRREFDFRLRSEWGRGARAGKSLALLMIDVDKFKQYNDHNGHLRGDDCLIAVAQILSGCMHRAGDMVARYGGEEFVALLPEAELDGALKVAETCLRAIREARIPHVTSNIAPHVTISIGVSAMLPVYDKSATLLVEQADISLYQAKQNGRDRVFSFGDAD
ncbi:MAG: diguanylate cyclase [Pseudomonadota bacterium]